MKLGERIYTPEEASQALGGMYAASTLKNMATRGEIAHLGGINGKTRQKIRFAQSHLEQFLETIEQPAQTTAARTTTKITEKTLKEKLRQHY